jgi:hypothetical protein
MARGTVDRYSAFQGMGFNMFVCQREKIFWDIPFNQQTKQDIIPVKNNDNSPH